MITLDKIVICPKCEGEGTIKAGNLRECHNHDVEICPDCGGEKLMKRTVTIKYERV